MRSLVNDRKEETGMKKFEEPKLIVEMLELEDVITTSTCTTDVGGGPCEFDMGGF